MSDDPRASSSSVAGPLADERNGLAVVDVSSLTDEQRRGMLTLLRRCYGNVSAKQFNSDLDEKEWVILGTDSGGIWCFSTLRTLRATVDAEPIVAFYSGDTASRPERRGGLTSAGTRLVIRTMFHEMMASSAGEHFYWFMISSTYKSYRLLPMVFRDFAPAPGRPLSAGETRIVAELCRMKGFDFDESKGIIHLPNPSVPNEVISDAEARRREDPHARFFRSKNKGADEGDRLASLTELSVANLTPLGARLVIGGE